MRKIRSLFSERIFVLSKRDTSFNYIQKPARPPPTISSLRPVIASWPFGCPHLVGLAQVSSSFLSEDQASHTADKLQGGSLHSYTPLRCWNGVPHPSTPRPPKKRSLARSDVLEEKDPLMFPCSSRIS